MFRRIVVLIIPLVFIIFTGCGGSDKDQAPPTNLTGKEHPDDMASRQDLENKLRMAKQVCVDAYAPALKAAAPVLYTNPSVPPQVLFNQPGPVNAALAATAPQQQQCADALNMAIYNITKMQGGKYWARNDVQQWFYGNLAAMGDRVASQIPPEALANPQFLSAMRASGLYITQTYVVPKINDPMARFQAQQQLSNIPI